MTDTTTCPLADSYMKSQYRLAVRNELQRQARERTQALKNMVKSPNLCFKCPFCNQQLNCNRRIHLHMLQHMAPGRLQCPYCPSVCSCPYLFKMHLKEDHLDKFYCPCNACKLYFRGEDTTPQPVPNRLLKASPDELKTMCHDFLSTLFRLAGAGGKFGANVKKLIQDLIDGVLEPEEFATQMQREVGYNQTANMADFLKKTVPHLQQALISGEMTIEGIRPPHVPASTPNLVPTAEALDPTTLEDVKSPNSRQKRSVADYKLLFKSADPPSRKMQLQQDIALDREYNKFITICTRRGVQVDTKSLLSASSGDAFDVRPLNQTLPSTSVGTPIFEMSNFQRSIRPQYSSCGCVLQIRTIPWSTIFPKCKENSLKDKPTEPVKEDIEHPNVCAELARMSLEDTQELKIPPIQNGIQEIEIEIEMSEDLYIL